jgi:EpsD family peptidyl-prolyl cis-trans isomerase
MNLRLLVIASAAVLAVSASGCSKKDEQKPATQVAARVNGDEITVHQINNVLARTPNIPAEAVPQAKREILNRLIDQQIARQQAGEKKLDRTPNVVQAIEAMKTDILARAYLEQVTTALPQVTQEEIKKYYSDHPQLFAQRRVFQVEEIALRRQDGLAAAMNEQAQKTRSMQGIAAWLRSKNLQFAQNERAIPSEEIPLPMLAKVHATKEGEIQISETAEAVSAFRIASSRPAPVNEATAAPRIQQFLFNQRAGEAVAKEMKRLKESAKVEYMGEFAEGAAPAKAAKAAPPAPAPAAPAATAAKAPAAAAPQPSPATQASANSEFEKGIRGLR